MKEPQPSKPKRGYAGLGFSIFAGTIGVILSIMLHELFHVLMHWKTIVHFGVFVNPWTLVEIDVNEPEGYDFVTEEIMAYCITIVVIVITIYVIAKIHDHYDKKSLRQTLVPKGSSLSTLSKRDFMKIVRRLLP